MERLTNMEVRSVLEFLRGRHFLAASTMPGFDPGISSLLTAALSAVARAASCDAPEKAA
jgi:hypothetical protein